MVNMNQELIIRILAIRDILQEKRTYKQEFLNMFPQYDTPKKRTKLNNVLYLRTYDKQLTTDLETFTKQL